MAETHSIDTGGASFSVTPVAGKPAARISDLDLSKPLESPVFAALRRVLVEYPVLVFGDQDLDAMAFHDFAGGFGSLQEHVLRKYRHDDYPGLSWLTNVAPDGSVDSFGVKRATNWHSDGSYTADPPALGILHAYETPKNGAGTLFIDMRTAFDQLAPDLQSQLRNLTGLHRHGAGPGGEMYDNSLTDEQEKAQQDVRHPAVTRHPDDGADILYVNETHTHRFEDMDKADSIALVKDLMAQVVRPDAIFHHHWTPGDLLIWDERSTIHRGEGAYAPTERRIMLRAIVDRFHE
ncbi:MAG: TauD/TfdA family dioxygenase [Alphaproteobacteria bacterium]|nr:TauD/TfdA family dioxygenase [Alphaproteobacteria bacterium]